MCQAVDVDFSNKIFFSDEAHFSLGGYVNKQNCHIWGSENPQIIEERRLHPEKSLFGALFGSSKTTMERLSPSIRSAMII